MIFELKSVRPLALAAAVIGLAVPAVISAPNEAMAQSASVTVRTGPAYDYVYADDYYEPGTRTRYYTDDDPVVVDRVYTYDRDNLRSDRRVRRFIDREREDGRR